MLYPFKLKPVYKEIIWGGKKIEKYFNRETPFDKTAESWELCERDDGMSVITNGELKGLEFTKLIADYREKVLGTESIKKYGNYFPLLIKIIDANDKLSVQVHPDDEYAQLHGEKNGKNELWYIIDAKKDAKLVYGLKDTVTKEDFAEAVKNGTIKDTLNEVPVKPGDAFFIPAGTVHAILDGILIAEIQQNSNTTYRIYDWDRVGKDGKPRELHVKEALDVVAFQKALPKISERDENPTRTILESKFFNIEEIKLDGKIERKTDEKTFCVIMNLTGDTKITYDDGVVELKKGDTVLIPAFLGNYSIEGKSNLVLSWI